MKCLICLNKTSLLFQDMVLSKYNVNYYRCSSCGFIQTESPYWLDEAYKTAITSTDIGLLSRNLYLSKVVFDILLNSFDTGGKFLDFGGGYGVLVRLLRDKGLNFYRQDIYCENIFAINHDIHDLDKEERTFDLVTCFEVLEHTDAPQQLFGKLHEYADNILCSTLLVPAQAVQSAADWWYFAPETGQHISFYTKNALVELSQKFNMNFYTNGTNLHLFSKKKFNKNPLEYGNGFKDRLINKLISYFQNSRLKQVSSLIENDVLIAKTQALKNH